MLKFKTLLGWCFLLLALVSLWSAPAARAQEQRRVPILMYHEIGDGPNGNYLEEDTFAAQVRWLADHGYRTVTLSRAYDYLRGREEVPGPVVALTFDDGYLSFYTKAAPVLRRYGMTATVCVTVGQVGARNHMTWEHLARLVAWGFEVASHTWTHPDLRRVSARVLAREVAASRRRLEERLGISVRFFCYPAGKYNSSVLSAVRSAGYFGAVTTAPGVAGSGDDPYRLPRVRVYRGMSLTALAKALKGR